MILGESRPARLIQLAHQNRNLIILLIVFYVDKLTEW